MSYLHTPRLIFSGDFLSDVSTVNNDPAHYNNKTFEKSFQEYGPSGTNGWWNPEGGANFDFKDCTVQRLVSLDGSVTATGDLIGEWVKGAEGRSNGKMVDLDPQQQGVSQLWAVKLRILTKNNDLLLEGSITVTAFRDLQYRQTDGAQVNGQGLGGSWTSVLHDLVWGEKAADYTFFSELRATTHQNKLSINLNGFGYYYNHAPDGRFSLGKILGAIGPWFDGEPETFAPCRRLYGVVLQSPPGAQPKIYFSNTNFYFDKKNSNLTIDFGSSFPVSNALGRVDLDEELVLAVSHHNLATPIGHGAITIPLDWFTPLGRVQYERRDEWLLETGGIVSVENIPNDICKRLAENQLILLNKKHDKTYSLIARESIDGCLLRADNFVQRLDYNQQNTVYFYAYQWGEKIPSGQVTVSLQGPTPVTPKSPKNPISEIPGNNYPADGITFDGKLTIKQGAAQMNLKGNKILNPRGYIDGQIYFLDYTLVLDQDGTPTPITENAEGPYSNDSISIHLRDYFEIPKTPTWSDIAVTMTQFSNLYPIMSKYLVDLADPLALREKTDILKFAFSRKIEDPNYMPATRDLSETKRLTILKWLDNPVILKADEAAKPKDLSAFKLAESPASEGQLLTEKQQRLKNAMRAKSGEAIDLNTVQLKF